MSKMIENYGDTLVAIDPKTMLFRSASGRSFAESMVEGKRVAGKQIEVPTINALHPMEIVTVEKISTDEISGMIHATVVGQHGHPRHFRVVEKKD